ncbi:MAG: aldo/keto reductase [Bryobacteraceae bacterium]
MAEKLKEIGLRYGAGAGQVAIAWTLRNHTVTGAIAGIRNAEQVRELTNGGIPTIKQEDWELLNRELATV